LDFISQEGVQFTVNFTEKGQRATETADNHRRNEASKVDEALEVIEVSESEVYDIEQSEYVRKAEVHDEQKETRLQGLKNQLAAAEGEEADELREEVEKLEARIEELTEFKSGTAFHTRSEADP